MAVSPLTASPQLSTPEAAACHEDVLAAALLPLVRVAWEDGTVDEVEAQELREATERLTRDPDRYIPVLEGLIADRPSWSEQEVALQTLATANNTGHTTITDGFLRAMINECENIARASGSLLGEVYRIEAREREVIDAIVHTLSAMRRPDRKASWQAVLNELKTPPAAK